MKTYNTCVAMLERKGLNRRQISALIGIDEAVLSRRCAEKQNPTFEALVVVNLVADLFELSAEDQAALLLIGFPQKAAYRQYMKAAARWIVVADQAAA